MRLIVTVLVLVAACKSDDVAEATPQKVVQQDAEPEGPTAQETRQAAGVCDRLDELFASESAKEAGVSIEVEECEDTFAKCIHTGSCTEAECAMSAKDWYEAGKCVGAELPDRVLQTFTGKGMRDTRPFKVPDGWEIQWKAKGRMNFQIMVQDDSGELVDVAANEMGNTKGSSFQPRGGEYMLKIMGSGPWTVDVVEVGLR